MLFTTNWLAKQFPSNQGKVQDNIAIKQVTTDSRTKDEGLLFVPIVGENFDGHDFVQQAIENGASAIIWDESKQLPDGILPDFPVYFVKDTLRALQDLSSAYRAEVNPIVIGVTGSNGKTTTKDLISAVVKTTYRTHATKGNFNNHIGLPLTILSMDRNTEVLIVEMGMSNFHEIDLLTRIARPDVAIITNIGESHIEFLGSREGIAKAKLEIIHGLDESGVLIIDGDEPLLREKNINQKLISCGFDEKNDYTISQVKIHTLETEFTLSDGMSYQVPLLGKHHAKNASFALALGKLLNIPTEKSKQALRNLELTGMRFELLKGINDVSIINDAYNASATSMKAAIEVVKQMSGFQQKVLVLGDILELGDRAREFHESVAEVIEAPITVLFTYGNHAKWIQTALQTKSHTLVCTHFASKEDLVQALAPYLTKHSLLLFKASRGLKFEEMIEAITTNSN
ncbi:UDP-N-acetylmuramoyl-tripeptide--D-alanyl-D-alanine ligase [Oceanobacillus polygoni]|uniref:UDP-N-acetylmuramoyl-tripeptide--D-alanyl-D-alanine ligase n=2 Tax=Oceanobacillus polygoni TaxID=1235259 RepID=A0A9X1CC15_9BACI|nr:UDP-N-acetylmuramoyl-tripeptide--D-alanyl-D-alanine ligase [Oceanobacillus polygoni]MBP2077546.1 UDP-N-acetylmuramoyl-tripeptide--D-alanyl-D-alanine ligase [Oceanobacillus polygoni]